MYSRIKNSKWSIFAVASMANIVASFGVNSMALALPSIAQDFGTTQANVSWLTLVYSLIPCCMLLFFGRLAELYGYKKQMIIGYIVFALVSIATPILSVSIGMLILMRCFQGLAYSILISITQAVVSMSFPPEERGKALGLNTTFISVGLAAGPTVGGLLLSHFSWKAIFYFNIPFCILGVITSILFMKPDEQRKEKAQIDYPGFLFFAAGAAALSFGLNTLKNEELSFINPWLLFLLAMIMLFAFILREKKAEVPMMPLSLFKNRAYSQANATNVMSYTAQQMVTYLAPFYLVNVKGLSSSYAGLIILANPVIMMIASPIGGMLKDKYGTKLPGLLGLALLMAGLFLLGRMDESTSLTFMLITLGIIGCGNGLSVSPINSTIMGSVPRENSGVASGTLATMRNFGQTMGVAFSTLILESRQAVYESSLSEGVAYTFAQRDTYYFGMLTLAVAVVLIATLPKTKNK